MLLDSVPLNFSEIMFLSLDFTKFKNYINLFLNFICLFTKRIEIILQ